MYRLRFNAQGRIGNAAILCCSIYSGSKLFVRKHRSKLFVALSIPVVLGFQLGAGPKFHFMLRPSNSNTNVSIRQHPVLSVLTSPGGRRNKMCGPFKAHAPRQKQLTTNIPSRSLALSLSLSFSHTHEKATQRQIQASCSRSWDLLTFKFI